MSDTQNIAAKIHGLPPKTPIFLLGASMGGEIALHASARNPENLAGVISIVRSASRFDSAFEMSQWHTADSGATDKVG